MKLIILMILWLLLEIRISFKLDTVEIINLYSYDYKNIQRKYL